MAMRFLTAVVALCVVGSAAGAEQARRGGYERGDDIERWTRALGDELEHLQEELQFDRPRDAGRWDGHLESALRAVFRLERSRERGDRERMVRDFQAMDQAVHELLDLLAASTSPRVRRAAARIHYADEQLHYRLAPRRGARGAEARETIARHAHVLEEESRQLQRAAEYDRSRPGRGRGPHRDIQRYADSAEHFHEVIEEGADMAHIRRDFTEMDRSWQSIVQQLNREESSIYLRRTAQRVNEVHNQLFEMLADDGPQHRIGPPPVTPGKGRPGPEPPRDRRIERPQVEFEIPGFGRFQLR